MISTVAVGKKAIYYGVQVNDCSLEELEKYREVEEKREIV